MRIFSSIRVACWALLPMILAGGFAQGATLQTLYPAATPLSGLVSASDGNFYGTSRYGGSNDLGTVFKLSPAGVYQVIHSFAGTADGANPCAALAMGPDGLLYGTCQYGGAQNAGTVFKIATSGSFSLLASLVSFIQGAEPVGGLVVGPDNALYGTTSSGGLHGFGNVFQISTNGSYAILYNFSGTDGKSPAATLISGTDGLLYGTTKFGGTNDCGTVFKITTAGTFSSLFSFNATNGYMPGALVQGSDNAFYGTTAYGGSSGFGSIFKVTPVGTFTSLHSMVLENLGSNPLAGLVFGADGNLYGSANYGGGNGFGSVFQATASGGFSSLWDFSGNSDGANPFATLVFGGNYHFYGTTSLGGTGGGGTFYELTTLHFDTIQILAGGQNVNYAGAGGTSNAQYTVLTATNLTIPRTNWIFAGVGQFDAAGRFSFTNAVNRQEASRYFLLSQP